MWRRSSPSWALGTAPGSRPRKDEVKQCCRTELQSKADALDAVRAATTMIHDVRQAA